MLSWRGRSRDRQAFVPGRSRPGANRVYIADHRSTGNGNSGRSPVRWTRVARAGGRHARGISIGEAERQTRIAPRDTCAADRPGGRGARSVGGRGPRHSSAPAAGGAGAADGPAYPRRSSGGGRCAAPGRVAGRSAAIFLRGETRKFRCSAKKVAEGVRRGSVRRVEASAKPLIGLEKFELEKWCGGIA